jgi:hypothetical protein
VCLTLHLIAGKLIIKNYPTQVTKFVVDLVGKCVEGMQMNWASYLVNDMEKDCAKRGIRGMNSISACYLY